MNKTLNITLACLSIFLLALIPSEISAATVPSSPTDVTATAISSNQINVFWNIPSNDGASPITGYKIEVKSGTGSYSVLSNTVDTTYSHTGLTTGTSYTYKVSAINSIGTSVASTEVSAIPTSSSTGSLPGNPTNLIGYAASPTKVNLFWSAPANNGGYPIIGYKIEYRVNSGTYTELISNTASTSTTYSHNGLVTNSVYTYRVYTITTFGTSSSPSSEVVVQPKSSSTTTVPGAPTNLVSSAVSSTQINLFWSAPTNNGGAPITGYKIEYKSGTGSYSTLTTISSTTYSHTGLTTGTSYTYKVSAINSVGTSSASNEATASPSSSSTTTTSSAPTNLTAVSSSATQINLSWNIPSSNGGAPITGYKIEYKSGTGSYSTLTTISSTTYSHTGLTTGTSYTYKVSAINSVGTSVASTEASATPATPVPTPATPVAPDSPTNLTAVSSSPTQVNLSWTGPSNNGGSPITGYKIEYKSGTGSYSTLTTISSTTYSHTGLTTGTSYTYKVSAINSVGTSYSSNEASAIPRETTTPTLTATDVSPTQIRLTWVAPSQTYGQHISSYKIEEKLSSGTFIEVDSESSTSFLVSGLTTGKTYTFVVSANFGLGSSQRSNEASATPTANSAPPPTTTVPGAPTNLTAVSSSATQINLSWNIPSSNGGAPITGYKIEYKSGTGSYSTLTTISSTTYSHTGLTTGTSYTYKVSAINSVGTSVASTEASATPSITLKLNKIENLTIDEGKLLSFIVKVTDSSLNDLVYSLDKNPPTGTKINANTGLFSWTPTNLQGTKSYTFDIVVKQGSVTDRQSITITVNDVLDNSEPTTPKPTPEPTTPKPTPEPTPEPTKESPIASFVDPTKDPKSYVDRYNNEPTYKKWFDTNFPQYSSIYEAVGLEAPKPLASFVDPTKDPQSYVDRYNNEPTYKKWFDTNFPQYSSIYEAVGLVNPATEKPTTEKPTTEKPATEKPATEKPATEKPATEKPKVETPQFGKCGAGTKLVNGICTLIDTPKVKPWWQFW